jgi:hypothetical protein
VKFDPDRHVGVGRCRNGDFDERRTDTNGSRLAGPTSIDDADFGYPGRHVVRELEVDLTLLDVEQPGGDVVHQHLHTAEFGWVEERITEAGVVRELIELRLPAVGVRALAASSSRTEMLPVDGDEQAWAERVLAVRVSRQHFFGPKRRRRLRLLRANRERRKK